MLLPDNLYASGFDETQLRIRVYSFLDTEPRILPKVIL